MSREPIDKRQIDELLAASEAVLREHKQNPERIGCPPKSVLEKLATFSVDQLAKCHEGGTPVDRDTLYHILTECYPCYQELLELRTKHSP